MKLFLTYFRLQLRRAARLLPRMLAVTLLLAVLTALSALLVAGLHAGDEAAAEPVRIGLVGDLEENMLAEGLQMLESMDRHLAGGQVKVYDPWVTRDLVPNQYHDFDAFLSDLDMVVILVGHSQLREHMDKLKGKVVLDTRHICFLPGTHRL